MPSQPELPRSSERSQLSPWQLPDGGHAMAPGPGSTPGPDRGFKALGEAASTAHCTLLLTLTLALGACQGGREELTASPAPPADEATAGFSGDCADHRPGFKNAYFGDLHTHTSFSLDAYFFNALTDPRVAHRFAKGEAPLSLPAQGSQDVFTPAREIRIDRPLDFNAVTDHAEFLGGFSTLCEAAPGSNALCDQLIGQGIRDDIRQIAAGNTPFQTALLQSLIADLPTSLMPWQETQQINEEEYDPCTYSTLHGYEYTSNSLSQMFHRNVIFRGDASTLPLDVFPAVGPTAALIPENGNDDWRLFDHLQSACLDRADCDVLTIVHNSNRSDGRMFLAAGESAGLDVQGDLSGVPLGRKLQSTDIYFPMTADDAALRRRIDRSIEMTQHKGQSECAAGVSGNYLANDESFDPGCVFEVDNSVCRGADDDPAACAELCTGDPWVDPPFCGLRDPGQSVVPVCAFNGPDGASRPAEGGDSTGNCRSPLDYYRYAMVEGQKVRQTLGINPYRVNITAALDTHAGDSGNAAETPFVGHGGVLDDDPHEQLGFWGCDNEADGEDPLDPGNCSNRTFVDFARQLNPGGLAGVWAPQNTREEIFDAIHRGETWGTSGPRMRIRSVASWEPLPDNICSRLGSGEDLSQARDLQPITLMGGDLPADHARAAGPYLAVWAEQDPEGNPLQQIDLIKGYLNADGEPKVRFFDGLVRTADPVSRPDPNTCAVAVQNHPESLCLRWQDSDFDPARDAYWYARVREVPSCRWSAHMCRVEQQVDCRLLSPDNGAFAPETGWQGYEGCCQIEETGGVFTGRDRFDTIEERAWASPIWYEPRLPGSP